MTRPYWNKRPPLTSARRLAIYGPVQPMYPTLFEKMFSRWRKK